MQKNIFRYTPLLFLLSFSSILFSKNPTINSIELKTKANGVIITMNIDSVINENDITAWQANSGWFYITLYRALGDVQGLKTESLPFGIIDFQLIQGDESFQIGLRLKRQIENHDFTFDENMLNINLRYSTEYFVSFDSNGKLNIQSTNNGLPNGIRKWLFLTGSGIAISGAVKNKDLQSNTQAQTGIAIITATYIIDKIWKLI